jgi:hypothetical protein
MMATWCKDQDMFEVAKAIGTTYVAFSANSTLDRNGDLVMGRGAAKIAKMRCPDSPSKLGALIGQGKSGCTVDDYHLAVAECVDWTVLAFQVKRGWTDYTPLLGLTGDSLRALVKWHADNGYPKVVLNCPLIGSTRLAKDRSVAMRLVESILTHEAFYVCVVETTK